MAVDNPDWFAERLDIENTFRADDSPVITQEMYQAEIDAGMDPQLVKSGTTRGTPESLFTLFGTSAYVMQHQYGLAKKPKLVARLIGSIMKKVLM
jgi:hypothetical protein